MAPLLRLLPGNLFELMEPVSASVGPIKIEVPAGFVTDLASIPSVLHWWIRPTDSRAATAAIVHDWLYLTHSVPRAVADALFLSLLRADGMPRIRAKAMIVAVNICGKRPYMRGPDKLKERCPHLICHICTTPHYE